MLKLTSAFREYKLPDLAELGLPDSLLHKTSAFDYADCVINVLKSMELKITASQWAIGYNDILFGCLQVSPANPNKEVQEINDFAIPNSVLKIYTRFSATSQIYAPTFFGCVFVDIISDPYLVSSGFVGERVHQAQGNFIQDVIEAGMSGCHAFSFTVKDMLSFLKKKKLKKHEAFGLLSNSIYEANLPITRLKKALDTLSEILNEKSGDINGIDVLKAAYAIHTNFSVPDQYEFLAKGIPTIFRNLK